MPCYKTSAKSQSEGVQSRCSLCCRDWNLSVPGFLFGSAPLENREVGPGSEERAHTSAQQMENLVDILTLKQLMKHVVNHSVPPISAIILFRRMNAQANQLPIHAAKPLDFKSGHCLLSSYSLFHNRFGGPRGQAGGRSSTSTFRCLFIWMAACGRRSIFNLEDLVRINRAGWWRVRRPVLITLSNDQ